MMDEIDEGKLVDYIIASATFPIFPPKIIDDKKYIDGGVYDNMPINLLVKNGYDKMLVIRTNVESKQPKRKVEGNPDLFFIAPKEDLGPAMAFSSSAHTRIYANGLRRCERTYGQRTQRVFACPKKDRIIVLTIYR